MARRKRKKELSVRKVRKILRMLEQNISDRKIGRSLSISHRTVGGYRLLVEESCLSYEELKEMNDIQLRNKLRGDKKENKLQDRPQPDWAWIHEELRKKGVTIQLLWQEYKEVYPEGYQSTQFCEHYSRWKKKLNVSMRQTHKAGEKMFVDYAGHTVPIIDRHTGKSMDAQIFIALLGASNYTYAEASWDQSLPNWIGSQIRAFEFFGGVTELIIPDNLKSGVTKACRYEPDINTTYHELSLHYDTVIIPARVRKPKDKAKAEVGVQVVERWILAALRNRTFFSLEELNEAIRELLEILNKREFKKLPGSRLSWFEKIDKPALKPLPQNRYEFAEWKKATVNIDYHVELNMHYYSVPYQLVHEKVEIRYTNMIVEIFRHGRRIISHIRSDKAGHATTLKAHMPKSHQLYLEWTPSRIIRWAGKTGEHTAKLVGKIMESRRHPEQGYRSCLGIIRLGKKYSEERLESACGRALAINGHSYKTVKSILENNLDYQKLPDKNDNNLPVIHKNIRGKKYYQ